MDTPLPDNLEPDGFKCIRIWYPDDAGYRRAVMGAVSYLQNWFAWERDDNQSGKRAAAKFREAYTLTVNDILAGKSCDDQTGTNDDEPPIPPPVVIYVGGGSIESEDDMGQVVTEVKRVGNELWVYYGHCCIDKIQLTVTGQLPQDPDNPIDDPDDDTQVWYPCGKAAGGIDAIATLLQAGLDNYASPLTFSGHLKDALPGISMSADYIYLFLFDLGVITKVIQNSDIINANLIQEMKCRAVEGMTNESSATIAELEFMLNAMKTVIFESYEYVAAESIWVLWEQAYQIIGPGDTQMFMQLNAATPENCDCPGDDLLPTDPTVNGWWLSSPFADSTHPVPHDPNGAFPLNDWGWAWVKEVAKRDIFGFVATITLTSGSMGIIKRANDPISFMGAYDFYLSGSNSDSFGQPLKIAQMNQAEFDELGLLAQGYTRVQPLSGDGYTSAATPPVTLGQIVLMAFSLQQSGSLTGVVTMSDFRWLHNTGSPNP